VNGLQNGAKNEQFVIFAFNAIAVKMKKGDQLDRLWIMK